MSKDKVGKSSKLSFSELQAWVDAGEPPITQKVEHETNLAKLMSQGQCRHPLATNALGTLGSCMVGRVILQTGQLRYSENLISLAGNIPLNLCLHYVSQDPHSGIFGQQWRFEYETTFSERITDEQLGYRLITAIGERFDFIYDKASNRLVDQSEQRIEVRWDSHKTDQHKKFTLSYRDGRCDVYQQHKLIEKRDRNNNSVHLDYDEQGRLISISNSSKVTFNLRYNVNNLVESVVDHSGREWCFSYNSQGLLSEVLTPSSAKRFYRYRNGKQCTADIIGLLTNSTNSLGHQRLAVNYYANGQVEEVSELIEGEGLVKQCFSYKLAVPHVSVQTQHQATLQYHMDEAGLVDRIRYPNDFIKYQQWHSADKSAVLGDCNGIHTTKRYDDRYRLIEKINDAGKTHYEYQGNSIYPALITGPKGCIKKQHDECDNLLVRTDEVGDTREYRYDIFGNCIEVIDSKGLSTQFTYNSMGQVISRTDAVGNTLHVDYDELGRVHQQMDAQGRATYIVHNENDQPTLLKDALEAVVKFEYDSEGQVTAIIDPAGNKTDYVYDDNGRLKGQRTPDGAIEQYIYQQNLLSNIILKDGTQVDYHYEDDGRQITEIIGDITNTYEYDHRKRLIRATNQHSDVHQSYSAKGKLDQQIQNKVAVNRTYRNGLLTSLSVLDHQCVYQHNAKEELQFISSDDSCLIEQQFNHLGQIILRDYPNNQSEAHQYMNNGALTNITSAGISIDYANDKSGLLVQKNSMDYQYDEAGRLVKSGDQYFSYDQVGNLLAVKNSELESTVSPNVIDQKTNQLLETPEYQLLYDSAGNIKTKIHKQSQSTTYYQFNALNQLESVQGESFYAPTKQFAPLDLEFSYDALGRRIYKRDGNTQYRYIYDQYAIVVIQKTLKGEATQTITIVHDQKVDTPLSITNENGTFYYHRDHQGSIIALTNESGEVVESISYDDSYGEIVNFEYSTVTDNPYCYTGREFDGPSLYYYRARYYDPSIKRFLSIDPIGFESGDYNHYRYVGNDPVNFKDPSGLLFFLVAIPEALALAGSWLFGTAGGAAVMTAGTAAVVHGPKIAKAAPKVMKGVSNAYRASTAIDLPGSVANEESGTEEKESDIPIVAADGAAIEGDGDDCGPPRKNKGDCAESLVNEKYKDQGFEEFDTKRIENGSGHGIDNILHNDTDVMIIETKANTAGLNKWQKLGGEAYLAKQLGEMRDAIAGDGGRWKSMAEKADFEDAIEELEEILKKNKDFKVCRVNVKEDPTGCYGKNGKGKCEADGDVTYKE